MTTDPDRDRLIASMLTDASAKEVADELEMDVDEVRAAAARGNQQRTWND